MFLHPLFAELPSEDRTLLVQESRPLFVKKGDVVLAAGSSVRSMFLVTNGVLQVKTVGADGTTATTGFIGPGDLFVESIDGDSAESSADLEAVLAATVHPIPLVRTRALMARYPAFAIKLLQTVLDDQQKLRKQLRRITASTPEAVIGRTLYELSSVTGAGPNTVDKRISQSVIASYAGLSRERVNRTMRELEGKGLIKRAPTGIVVDGSFSRTDFNNLSNRETGELAED